MFGKPRTSSINLFLFQAAGKRDSSLLFFPSEVYLFVYSFILSFYLCFEGERKWACALKDEEGDTSRQDIPLSPFNGTMTIVSPRFTSSGRSVT